MSEPHWGPGFIQACFGDRQDKGGPTMMKALKSDLAKQIVHLDWQTMTARTSDGTEYSMVVVPKASARPKDHNIRQLVNDLRDTAVEFHKHGSLRDRIAGVVMQFIDCHFPKK